MAEPYTQTVVILPLAKAVLCQDCAAVSNGVNHCPACGSAALASIARWLERETEGTTNDQADNQESLPLRL